MDIENFSIFVRNNIYLFLIVFLLMFFLIIFQIKYIKNAKFYLSIIDSIILMNKNSSILIDIRKKEKFNKEHISGAINLEYIQNLNKDYSKIDILKNNKKKDILLVCDFGKLSNEFAIILNKLGYKKIFIIDGGIKKWKEENYPLINNITIKKGK